MIIPFLIRLQVTLSASSTGRMQYAVSNDETVEIDAWFQKSTGAFDVYGVSDSRGNLYSNAAAGSALDSDFIQDVASANISNAQWIDPIILPGGTTFNIDVIDTSGAANTVEFMLVGRRKLGQDR